MPRTLLPKKFGRLPAFMSVLFPLAEASNGVPELISGSNRDLKMTFEDQLKIMVYFHLKDFQSGRHLLQDLKETAFCPKDRGTRTNRHNGQGLSHDLFDQWQENDVHFVCRIKGNTQKTCIKELSVEAGGNIFYDAIVRLGQPDVNKTKKDLRLVGYKIGDKKYWVATDRFDLTADQIALIYKLRWNVESFLPGGNAICEYII